MVATSRKSLSQAKKIVLKIGSSVLTHGTAELQTSVFDRLASEICHLQKEARQFIIVSSGAIVAGRAVLKFKIKNLTIPQKQAAAAVGQGHLIHRYELAFSKFGKVTAQSLLTHDDLSDRTRFLNARHTLSTLLQNNVIPIINENDSVIVEEIKFGDNDTLGALITSLAEADLLILLTDLDGLFDADPKKDKKARLIPEVHSIDERIVAIAQGAAGELGVGGMSTKVQAARRAASYGIPTLIANGHQAGILEKILRGENVGTLFLPEQDRLTSRKHWIAHTLRPCGRIQVDDGAQKALASDGKSLLPKGIAALTGDFDIGDAVEVANAKGEVFAQGIVSYSAKELLQIRGKNTSEIEKILGYKYYDEVIHRDDLVVLKKS